MKIKMSNFKESNELIGNTPDKVTKNLMMLSNFHALGYALEQNKSKDNSVMIELDLLLFQKIMERFFADKNKLNRVLQGEDLDKWF